MTRIRLSKEPRPAELIEVIRTELLRKGRGIEESPVRIITQFWTKDGELLAEVDPWTDKEHIERAEEIRRAVTQAAEVEFQDASEPARQAMQKLIERVKELASEIEKGDETLVNVDDPRLGRG